MFSSVPIVVINISCVMRYFIFYMLSIFIYSCSAPGIVISRHAVDNIGMLFLFSQISDISISRRVIASLASQIFLQSAKKERRARARAKRKEEARVSAEGVVACFEIFRYSAIAAPSASRRSLETCSSAFARRASNSLARIPARALISIPLPDDR